MQQGMVRLNRTGDRPHIYFDFFHDLRISQESLDRTRSFYLARVESWSYRILDDQRP